MTIRVRLFATLRTLLPAPHQGPEFEVELPEFTTIAGLLEHLQLDPRLAQLVLVDGHHTTDRRQPLAPGATVSIFPPVAGG